MFISICLCCIILYQKKDVCVKNLIISEEIIFTYSFLRQGEKRHD